jgi:hypothetical protein
MSGSQTPASLREIVGGVASDAQSLVRGEIALARAELDQKIDRIVSALIWVVGGMLLGFAGLVVILNAAAAALAIVLPVWAASLIVGVVIAGLGAILARSGTGMLSLKTLTPNRTAANLQQDARVVKEHT